jgi:hypothetical protein
MLALMVPLAFARAAEPGQTQWKIASFTWVKRVPAEPGAPANAHPAALEAKALTAALAKVTATLDGHELPLFAQDELLALSPALGEALALAQPGEDLVLLSTWKRGNGFMEPSVGLTARLFVRDGALNLLVHEARLNFMDRYLADRTLPTFAYGSRTAASGASLQAPGATRLRNDWLALPISATPQVPAPAMAPLAPAPLPAQPAPDAPAGPRDAAFYEAQRERLKALKRLRDENLITEAEYQDRRGAIVKTL